MQGLQLSVQTQTTEMNWIHNLGKDKAEAKYWWSLWRT